MSKIYRRKSDGKRFEGAKLKWGNEDKVAPWCVRHRMIYRHENYGAEQDEEFWRRYCVAKTGLAILLAFKDGVPDGSDWFLESMSDLEKAYVSEGDVDE